MSRPATVTSSSDESNTYIVKSSNTSTLPALPVDLRAHKLVIGINWFFILLTSCVLPLVGYFALYYGTSLPLTTVLSIFISLFGASSLYSLGLRTWRLTRPAPKYRPLGTTSRWCLDFFQWNFIGGFLALTAMITAGLSLKTPNRRIVSLPLSILIIQVCVQLVSLQLLSLFNVRAPFRISSLPNGGTLQAGVFVIAEDIVAVDGNQGIVFREAWQARYAASVEFRQLMTRLDWMWGISGLLVATGIIATVFAVDDPSIGYGVGWAVPWIWAGGMALVTLSMGKAMLRREVATWDNGAEKV